MDTSGIDANGLRVPLTSLEELLNIYDKIDEKKLNAWSNKGSALLRLGKMWEANECFDNALKIDDRDKMSWLFKGYSLGQLLRIEEAKICLSIAEKLDE